MCKKYGKFQMKTSTINIIITALLSCLFSAIGTGTFMRQVVIQEEAERREHDNFSLMALKQAQELLKTHDEESLNKYISLEYYQTRVRNDHAVNVMQHHVDKENEH